MRVRGGARDGLSCSRSPLDVVSRPLGSRATTSSHLQVPPPRHSPASRSPRQPAPPSLKPSSYMALPRPRCRNIRDVAYDHWRAGYVDMASMAIMIARPRCQMGGCGIKRRAPRLRMSFGARSRRPQPSVWCVRANGWRGATVHEAIQWTFTVPPVVRPYGPVFEEVCGRSVEN